MKQTRSLGCVLRLLIAALAVTCSCPAFALSPGEPAPGLEVTLINGSMFKLGDQKGKVVLVDFWATWCPSCKQELSALDSFYHRYHSKGLQILAINVDSPRDKEKVLATAQKLGYPVALARAASVNGFPRPSTLPLVYLVDAKGVLRMKLKPEDGLNAQTLAKVVLPFLKSDKK